MSSVCDSHTDRISKIEENIQELLCKTTEALVKNQFMAEKLQDTSDAIVKTLENSLTEIKDNIKETNKKLNTLVPKVAELEKEKEKRSNRWKLVKKVGLPTVTAVGSCAATYFGNSLFESLLKTIK